MGGLSRLGRQRVLGFGGVALLAAALCFALLAISMSQRSDAAFPGGNGKIAYSLGDAYTSSIWSANADGGLPNKLTTGSGDSGPSYSANGSRIAFERENGVAVMNADGSGLTKLLSGGFSTAFNTEWEENYKNPEEPSQIIPFVKISTWTAKWHTFNGPSFYPDGSQLAVGESKGEYFESSICEVEKAKDAKCVSSYEGGFFNYEEGCLGCTAHIIAVNSTTGVQTGEVTPNSSAYEDYEPTVSAAGKVAFTRWTKSSKYAIFVVDSPGGTPVQVTNGPNDYLPDFSPDGSRIAFTHGEHDIGMVGVGGGPITILSVPNPPGAEFSYVESPVFSPDGSKIAFERTVYPSVGKSEHGVVTMGNDGSGLTQILAGARAPSWQPIPAPPPPPAAYPATARAKKGAAKVDKKGKVTPGTITCGSSPCALKVLSAKLKAGKETCSVKAKLAKSLDPGGSAKVGVKVAGKCLEALKKAGKGSLVVKVQVTDGLGEKVLTLRSTVVAVKAKKGRR
jgi:dipeptidyl aminopeptidase/acylaminoacyl peptidase